MEAAWRPTMRIYVRELTTMAVGDCRWYKLEPVHVARTMCNVASQEAEGDGQGGGAARRPCLVVAQVAAVSVDGRGAEPEVLQTVGSCEQAPPLGEVDGKHRRRRPCLRNACIRESGALGAQSRPAACVDVDSLGDRRLTPAVACYWLHGRVERLSMGPAEGT